MVWKWNSTWTHTQCQSALSEHEREQERNADHGIGPQEQQQHVNTRIRHRKERHIEHEPAGNEHGRADPLQNSKVDVVRQVVGERGQAMHAHHDQYAVLFLLDQRQHEDWQQKRQSYLSV